MRAAAGVRQGLDEITSWPVVERRSHQLLRRDAYGPRGGEQGEFKAGHPKRSLLQHVLLVNPNSEGLREGPSREVDQEGVHQRSPL